MNKESTSSNTKIVEKSKMESVANTNSVKNKKPVDLNPDSLPQQEGVITTNEPKSNKAKKLEMRAQERKEREMKIIAKEEEKKAKEKEDNGRGMIDTIIGKTIDMQTRTTPVSREQKAEIAEMTREQMRGNCEFLCITSIRAIILLCKKYSAFIGCTHEIQNYLKAIMLVNNKKNHEREPFVKTHVNSFYKLMDIKIEELRKLDLTWLSNKEEEILITYGRNKMAKLPLSTLYIHLNKLNSNQGIRDATTLDYNLWCLFRDLSLARKAVKDADLFAEQARELHTPTEAEDITATLTESIRDIVINDPVVASIPEDMPTNMDELGTVFTSAMKQLQNSPALGQMIQGLGKSLANGSLDLNTMAETVYASATKQQPPPERDEERDEETEDE